MFINDKKIKKLIRESLNKILINEAEIGTVSGDFYSDSFDSKSGEFTADGGDQKGKNLHKTWKGKLGKYKKRNINFHKVLDLQGRNLNNYRGALSNKFSVLSKELLQSLKDDYGIKRIITLNADNGGKKIKGLASKISGLEQFNFFMGENSMPDLQKFNQIKELIKKGNNLIHCTHGADRTGAMVGRYYVEEGIMTLPDAIKDTKSYGGHKEKAAMEFLESGPK